MSVSSPDPVTGSRNVSSAPYGLAPLIDRELLFGNPDVSGVSLSPDGKFLSFLAPFEGVLNIWVAPVERQQDKRLLTRDAKRGIRNHSWAYTNDHILYLQDEAGDENWHIHIVDVKTGETKNLTPFPGVQAEIEKGKRERPTELVVGLNKRDPKFHDLYLLDIVSGELKLIEENRQEFAGYLLDSDFNVRFAQRYETSGAMSLLRKVSDQSFETFLTIPPEDTMTSGAVTISKDGSQLFFRDSRGRDTGALTTIFLDTGKQKVLAQDARADASDILFHPTNKHVEAVAFYYERKSWVFLDEKIKSEFEFLTSSGKGDFEVTSRTLDDDRWVVAFYRDDGPVEYYLFTRASKELRFLFTNRKVLEGLPLVKMLPKVITARDGLKMVCYLSLPLGTEPKAQLPMVLLVHGGPWARDAWGFNPYHQLLANRGYAVLSVNFRGSTGFGKDFANAAKYEWGRKMHDDLLDAVNWCVRAYNVDPDRVGIMGGSYGGYAALAGLTFTPDFFACAVDIVGPSNLQTLLNSIPPYWESARQMFKDRMGNPDTEEGRALLEERSPLNFVDRIKKPLLIGQGANDPRVKQSESDQIVASMKERKIPVTYVLYPDEGHGFARPQNNLAFSAITEAFLAQSLGGRAQPLGKVLEASTAQICEGRAAILGVHNG